MLAVSIVALMVLSAVPLQEATAQGSYSEKLNVFVAGNDAFWYFTFGGINGSNKLSALESTPGLSWYNITAIKTTGWASDFQIFGPRGYNLIPVPFIAPQGLFLTVGSDSFNDASAAAAALDSYLLTSFTSLSNGTGTYSFYSPLSFSDIIPSTLFRFMPYSEGGFASALTSSSFAASASPFLMINGQKAASGFSHSMEIGSISANALDSTSKPNVLGYFGGSVSSLKASSNSVSSVVQLRSMDGVVKSSDPATVTSNSAQFSGSYTLTLAAGKKVTKFNATVVEQPAALLATRAVDAGVLRTGDDIAVTLSFTNLSPSYSVTKVKFSDNWWNQTGEFKFLSGNYTVPSGAISPGGTITPVYRLQYTGTVTASATIPASLVHYTYQVGGASFNGMAVLNPIRLSLGVDEAVVYATVVPVGVFGKTVGQSQNLTVKVTNVGTLPASSVVVSGQSISGLAAKSGGSPGGTATVTVSQSASTLLTTNITSSFLATYQDPGGSSLNATTNVLSDVFSHSSMVIGFPTLVVTTRLSTLANRQTNVTLSFTASNSGAANVTSFSASASLPTSLGCGTVTGKGLSCSGNLLTISYSKLNRSSSVTTYMKYSLTSPQNYILGPIGFTAMSSGNGLSGRSNPVGIPSGVVLTKQFTPGQLFGGMNSQVEVSATNTGPLTVYNATVATLVDSFDSLSSASSLSKGPASLAAGGNVTFSYGVTASQTYGNLTGASVSASFFFGAAAFSTLGAGPRVQIYQPLSVSILTLPATPEEGKNFTITFQILNPSGVPVSNVLFTLPVPAGLGLSKLQNAQVSAGLLTVTAGSLGPHSSTTATASAVASSGIVVPFDKAKLTFTYAGVTINGLVPKAGIGINEDVTTRYLIPTAFILLALLATAFYVRRKAAPSVPASQK